jgi:multiple sugar transport system substrate-binding protein
MRSWYKYITIVVFVAIAVTLVTLIFYNGRDQDSETDNATTIYFADNISIAHAAIIEKFNTAYKNEIRVIPIDLPFSKFSTNERKELLARALRGKGERIDIFAVDHIWVPRFARWAESLDLYFKSSDKKRIISYAKESCFYKGRLVSLPLYIDLGVLYYRDDLLRSLPDYQVIKEKLNNSMTWSEFLVLSERLKGRFPYTYLYAADNFEGLVCTFFELLQEHSSSIFRRDSVRLNIPAAQHRLQLMVDLIHRYEFVPPAVLSFNENQCYEYALTNEVPFLRGWPGFKKQFNRDNEISDILDQMAVAPLPHFEGRKSLSVFGGWNLMIPKETKYRNQAIEFMHFVLQRENQELLYEIGGFLPVISEIYEDADYLRSHPELAGFRKMMEFGFHRPYLEDYTKISDILSFYLHLAVKGEISVRDALTEATKRINSKQVLIR